MKKLQYHSNLLLGTTIKRLQEDLLAHEDLCECLANGPPIGAAASGFL
jgi:hypothetical protein